MDEHTAAVVKVEAARELLFEAYKLWPTAEIRRVRERLDDALGELEGA